jgi:putative Holliday junction resolvase
MREQTLMGFDFGTKRIGVALGNTILLQARAVEIIQSEVRKVRFARIEALIKMWQPNELVVGLPLTQDDQEQLTTVQSRRFAQQLQGRFNLPVHLVDERDSSLQAQETVGNRPDDAFAAAIILQRYLDAWVTPQQKSSI